ncbi:hypothetical protein Bbelb_306590 [Branchiostoma belcheri]|nr:hypothetical protein Bbelb_306590 [Branchiostoma belcheri]
MSGEYHCLQIRVRYIVCYAGFEPPPLALLCSVNEMLPETATDPLIFTYHKPRSQAENQVTDKEEEAAVVWTCNQSEGYLSSHYTAREGGGCMTEGASTQDLDQRLERVDRTSPSQLTSLAEDRQGWKNFVDCSAAPMAVTCLL